MKIELIQGQGGGALSTSVLYCKLLRKIEKGKKLRGSLWTMGQRLWREYEPKLPGDEVLNMRKSCTTAISLCSWNNTVHTFQR